MPKVSCASSHAKLVSKNRVKTVHSMFVASGHSRLGIAGYIPIEDSIKRVSVNLWQRSWMQKWKEKKKCILQRYHEWRNESLHTSRPLSNLRIAILTLTSFMVMPEIPLWQRFFGGSEEVQRAALRRG